jgi:orotate phosphoribosyltransferase
MELEPYKQKFIEFMVRSEVLLFGDFTTKSGRQTPYFINTGKYRTGRQMHQLGKYYAEAIRANFADTIDVLFGPAYKGIPLVVTSAIALADHFDQDISFCFNRKEAKKHGEKGVFVGKTLSDGDRVLIVEDVTTAGTSIRETVPLLRDAADIRLMGLIVSVDRMERGHTEKGALAELAEEFAMKTRAIVTIDEVVGYLYHRPIDGTILIDDPMKASIDAYREKYGCR